MNATETLRNDHKQIRRLEKIIVKCYTKLYQGDDITLSDIEQMTTIMSEFLDSIHYSREEDAYFHLRGLGYFVVARNYRSPRRPGEIDLIAWDADVLCFIEVKTRTSHDVKPAEAAVDRAKQHEIAGVAHQYLRRMPPRTPT